MKSSEISEPSSRRPAHARADRLSKALQANISRRKAQARGRNAQNESLPDAEPARVPDTPVRKDQP